MAKYKNEGSTIYKKIFIILIILLFIFMIILITVKNNQKLEQEISSGEKLDSVENILKYYGCKYIKMIESTEPKFSVDIYTSFREDLYTDDTSNEKFYNTVINRIAQFLGYRNFRMIDETKEEPIEIKVIGNGYEIETIYINGIEDYFIYMDSQISLKKYKEIPNAQLKVQAPELIECIQNNWNNNIQFGTRESIFQNYYIYFDEGIKTRSIDGKIYNIVFTEKYKEPVIEGISTFIENNDVITKLGKPAFINDDKSIIGYKTNELYVFFEKNQISIYRNIKEEGYNEFFELADKLINEEETLLDFMNDLTYLWPDYEEYTYDTDKVFLSYPNKGIDIKINYDNTNGIVLYNNIGISQKKANNYLEHTEFTARLQVDNVFNAEQRRIEKENEIVSKCNNFKDEYEKEKYDDDRNRKELYNYYGDIGSNNIIKSMYFISNNPNFINCELKESINTYVWLNEYYFIYSRYKEGIYYYDLKNQTKGIILQGDEKFEIQSIKDDILKYDDKQLKINW